MCGAKCTATSTVFCRAPPCTSAGAKVPCPAPWWPKWVIDGGAARTGILALDAEWSAETQVRRQWHSSWLQWAVKRLCAI